MDSPIAPYTIDVPQSELDTIKAKLDLATLPKEAPVAEDWKYGSPLTDVRKLVEYWRDGFDWRAQEAKLNELPHFRTEVPVEGFGSIGVHFVHQRSDASGAIPLLFSHGWPGSFLEVTKLLPLLTKAEKGVAFHVVAPSLANFGFSDGVGEPGFSISQHAEAFHKLMLKLGYDRYVTQGGDWGSAITRVMGIRYPDHCLASHLNFLYLDPPSLTKAPLLYLKDQAAKLLPGSTSNDADEDEAKRRRTDWFLQQGHGYSVEQGTKPSTLGFALADSPVATLAWIYEKLHDWTDAYPWTPDEVLTWVAVYVFSVAGPDAASRIYYEFGHSEQAAEKQMSEFHGGVKLGWSQFPKDLLLRPRSWADMLGPVVFERHHGEGGHFAAWERPGLLAGDLRDMFGEGGGAADVVEAIARDQRSG